MNPTMLPWCVGLKVFQNLKSLGERSAIIMIRLLGTGKSLRLQTQRGVMTEGTLVLRGMSLDQMQKKLHSMFKVSKQFALYT